MDSGRMDGRDRVHDGFSDVVAHFIPWRLRHCVCYYFLVLAGRTPLPVRSNGSYSSISPPDVKMNT